MSNINNSFIKKLLAELPGLREQNLIDGQTEERLRAHYLARQKEHDSKGLVFIFLTLLASLFIIGGIILLIGYNWGGLSQRVKVVLSFVLLLLAQGAGFYLMNVYKGKVHLAAREGLGLFWAVAFGASVALMGQIFHIPADYEKFYLIWSISTLLLLYLFNSLALVTLYMGLIITLTTYMQNDDKFGLLFIPLFLAVIPHYVLLYRKESHLRATLYNYILVGGATIGLGIAMEKSVPGLWIVVYSSMFVFFYLFARLFENKKKEESLFYSPMLVSGVLGIAILAFIFSAEWAWEDIGFSYYRKGERFHEWASIFDYIISVAFPLAGVALGTLLLKRGKKFNPVLAGFGILIIPLYLITSYLEVSLAATWTINLYIAVLSLYGLYSGYKKGSLLLLNSSMVLFTVTLLYRFFDEDMSLLVRGIVFIVCGASMLAVNLIFMKKRKRGEA